MTENDLIDTLHRELNFDQYVPELQKVKGVWNQILNLQQRVRRDGRALKQYRAFVERCVKQLTEADPELPADAIDQAVTDLLAWQAQRIKELGIDQREGLRVPATYQAWCEKNLPREWENVQTAFAAAIDRTSQRTLTKLRTAWDEMLTAYSEH